MTDTAARRVVRKGDPRSVYVGRPTFLGNPFVIGRDGDRAEVIAKYAAWFAEHVSHPKNAERVRAYCQDYDLACWCAPLPCHADVIAEWLDAVVVESTGAVLGGAHPRPQALRAATHQPQLPLLPAGDTMKPEQWYIATDLFDHGGEILDGWGPFPNMELAIRVRTLVEDLPVNKRANRTFAVDKR